MEFTKNDMIIMIAMLTTVVLLTFTFSALGMSDESVSASELPKYNSSADNFKLAGEFPKSPGTPNKFTLTWNDKLKTDSNSQIWLDTEDNKDNGTSMYIKNVSNTNDTIIKVKINNWENGNLKHDTEFNLTEEGDYKVFTNYSYTLYIIYDEIRDPKKSDSKHDIFVRIRERKGSSDMSSIPIIGGIISAGGNLYGVVTWIGHIVFWFSAMIVEVVISMVLSLYNIIAFFVSMMWWLLSTYSALVINASAWAKIFVTIPSILLMFEFTKLIMIGVKLLPTT